MVCRRRVQTEDKKKRKKKLKLDMHEQQLFIDGPDVSQSAL